VRVFHFALAIPLLFGPALFAQDNSKTQSHPLSPLAVATGAARSTLQFQQVEPRLSQAQAEQLLRACSTLAQADADEYRTRCVSNPAVLWSVRFLSRPTTKLSPRMKEVLSSYSRASQGSTIAGSATGPSSPGSLADPDLRSALTAALSLEIDDLSVSYQRAAETANVRKRLAAEAKLNVLVRDVRKALGDKAALLPDDPLALAGEEAILQEIGTLKAYKFRLDHIAANFPLPDTVATLQSIDDRLARLDAIIKSDQPGQFHRARDSIAAGIDLAVFIQLTGNRQKTTETELTRLQRDWSSTYPAIALPPPNQYEQLVSQVPDKLHPLSGRALEATTQYETDPARWLALESSLLATHAALTALPPSERKNYGLEPMPAFQQWRASLLTDRDLNIALMYSVAASGNKSAFLTVNDEVPFAPDLDHHRYRRDVTEALRAEVLRRKAASAPKEFAAIPGEVKESVRFDPENKPALSPAEKLFRVRLAEGRYESLAAMPPLIQNLIRNYVREVHDSDLARAAGLYRKLTQQNELAALSSVPLDGGQQTKLEKARRDVTDALLRLDVVIKAREQKGFSWSDAGKRDLAAMIAVLSSRPPPGELDGPSSTPSEDPRPPSDPPTPAPLQPGPEPKTPEGGAVLSMSDAPLTVRFATASQSIAVAAAATAPLKTSAVSVANDKGKLVVSEAQMRTGQIDFSTLPKDNLSTRLPERLSKWKGFIDPKTEKPYDYESRVKNFRDFAPVGGGIHMGDKATVLPARDLSHFVLSYDRSLKSLLLVGPAGERYAYGPMEPEDAKALYRYAASGHNAAVSIGWAGEYDPTDKRHPGEPQPVLLDPYLVDTRVGQDLISADSIPWDLGRYTLPGGEENPVSKRFSSARDRFFRAQFGILEAFCRGVPAFSDTYATKLATKFSNDLFLDLVAQALLTSSTVEAAKESFFTALKYAELQAYEKKLKELANPTTTDDLLGLQDSTASTRKKRYQDLYDQLYGGGLSGTQPNSGTSTRKKSRYQDLYDQLYGGGLSGGQPNSETSTRQKLTYQELYDQLYGSRQKPSSVDKAAVQAELAKVQEQEAAIQEYARIFDPAKKRSDVLEGLAILAVESSKADSKWVELLAALERARRPVSDSELAKVVYSVLPTTTLAVLLDEPTQIRLESGRIVLNGKMRYRYATSLLRVREGTLVMSEGTGPTLNRVETITELTDLANTAFPLLTQRYAPLQRVTEYARIAAFFRWARKPGNLLAVDLATLGEVPSSDRERTPTPDALAQSDK